MKTLTWNDEGTVVADENGNIATLSYWVSRERAEASLRTLVNCSNCRDCSGREGETA